MMLWMTGRCMADMADKVHMLQPPWPWSGREDVRDFCALLDGDAAPGTKARLVGGAVRDAMLNVTAADIDIATPHRPEKVCDIAAAAGIKTIPTGIAHGTVTALLESGPVEVTTLRRDVSTDGRHATIAFSQDWREDAARRDFTFNALYAEAHNGHVHDYFDGYEDLKAGVLRFIGDAQSRIEEDYLRILRLFRFQARFGAQPIAFPLLALCRQMGPKLATLSRERVASELLRLLMADAPLEAMQAMADAALWRYILPDMRPDALASLKRLIMREKQHSHSAQAMTRLAALLPEDKAMADIIAATLRLSNADRRQLRVLLCVATQDLEQPRALAYRLGNALAMDAALLCGSDAQCTAFTEALSGWSPPDFPIRGRDLLALDMVAGPELGKMMAALETGWIAEGFPAIEDKASYIRAHLKPE